MNLPNNVFVKRALIYSAASLIVSTAGAQSTSVESQLMSCASRTTDAVRLACYDGLADSLSELAAKKDNGKMTLETAVAERDGTKRPRAEPSADVPLVDKSEQPVVVKTETFDTGVAQKQSIRVMIEKTKRNARSEWYFYFDNGEVWKQIDTRNRRIPPLPVAATVSRGIFSSHKLHIDGEVWAMKVRRVK